MGVVAEKIAIQVPFCTNFLTSSTTHLLANSTENEIWIYDMKGVWEKIDFLTIPQSVGVIQSENSNFLVKKNGGTLFFFD